MKTQGDPVEPLKELKTRSKNLEYARIDAADVVGGRPCFVTPLIGQRARKFGAAGYVNPAIGVEKDVLVILVGSLGVTADVGTARKVEGMAVPVGFQGRAGDDRGDEVVVLAAVGGEDVVVVPFRDRDVGIEQEPANADS